MARFAASSFAEESRSQVLVNAKGMSDRIGKIRMKIKKHFLFFGLATLISAGCFCADARQRETGRPVFPSERRLRKRGFLNGGKSVLVAWFRKASSARSSITTSATFITARANAAGLCCGTSAHWSARRARPTRHSICRWRGRTSKTIKPIICATLFFILPAMNSARRCCCLTWFFFIVAGCALLDIIEVGTGTRLSLWIGGVLLVVVGAWFALNISLQQEPRGIIVSPPGEVRNGPGLDYAVGFTIPEGSNVVVLNKRPDWIQIGLPQQGLKGWLPTSDVELINSASL